MIAGSRDPTLTLSNLTFSTDKNCHYIYLGIDWDIKNNSSDHHFIRLGCRNPSLVLLINIAPKRNNHLNFIPHSISILLFARMLSAMGCAIPF